ncbi:MAG: DUF1801 domain-containing protein [Henriciella sp.]|nr:DUF1801 domain-containing protein [Henriciella sp.]
MRIILYEAAMNQLADKSSGPPAPVAEVYDTFPDAVRSHLLQVRAMIFATAADDKRIGVLTETLKWGQPSYLTHTPKSGTTIRLGLHSKFPGHCALFVPCQTSLVAQWRDLYTGTLSFDGNRAILLDPGKPLPGKPLRHCIAMALIYHLDK